MSDLSNDATDDGFHEIQLSGKQLVFLFMATTVVFPVPINLLEGFFKRDGMSDAVASKKREPVGAV